LSGGAVPADAPATGIAGRLFAGKRSNALNVAAHGRHEDVEHHSGATGCALNPEPRAGL
jgi:hypothetical protein